MVSPIYCVFEPKPVVHNNFLIKLLKTDAFTQRFAAATNASVDRRGSLRWKEFSKIGFDLPSLEEQMAIAAVIEDAERAEKMLMNQRVALREEKGCPNAANADRQAPGQGGGKRGGVKFEVYCDEAFPDLFHVRSATWGLFDDRGAMASRRPA